MMVESPIEEKLGREFSEQGLDFLTQVKIGKYRVDFLFPFENLVVEADGWEYHSTKDQVKNDFQRDHYLARKGYRVLRFRAVQINRDIETCLDKILVFLGRKSPP
jgi:very-short-patch-repair endonuclease